MMVNAHPESKKHEHYASNANNVGNDTYFIVFFTVVPYFVDVVDAKQTGNYPKIAADGIQSEKLDSQQHHHIVYSNEEKGLRRTEMPAFKYLFGDHDLFDLLIINIITFRIGYGAFVFGGIINPHFAFGRALLILLVIMLLALLLCLINYALKKHRQ
jgi:hypothetical protein